MPENATDLHERLQLMFLNMSKKGPIKIAYTPQINRFHNKIRAFQLPN